MTPATTTPAEKLKRRVEALEPGRYELYLDKRTEPWELTVRPLGKAEVLRRTSLGEGD